MSLYWERTSDVLSMNGPLTATISKSRYLNRRSARSVSPRICARLSVGIITETRRGRAHQARHNIRRPKAPSAESRATARSMFYNRGSSQEFYEDSVLREPAL